MRENWKYFLSLVWAYPKATFIGAIIFSIMGFLVGFVYFGLNLGYSLMLVVGGLITVIPQKAFWVAAIRDHFRTMTPMPMGRLVFFVLMFFLFGLVGSPFIFPVLIKYVDLDATYVEQEQP